MKVHTITQEHKITTRQATDLDENRIRFNWGYHDGADDCKNHRTRIDNATPSTIRDTHYDTVYALGYVYGYNDARLGDYEGNSNQAWAVALAEKQVTDGITDYNTKQWKTLIKSS